MSNNPNDNNSASFIRTQNAELSNIVPQPRSLLMAHSGTIPSFQRRTADSARQLRDNFNSVIREIQPLVETARTTSVQNAISISSFLSRPVVAAEAPRAGGAPNAADNHGGGSVVITLDDAGIGVAAPNHGQDDDGAEHPNNNNADDANNPERLQTVLEAQQIFNVLLKYIPFILILFCKTIYDYHEGIFIFVVLFVVFAHSNSTVKKETTKRHRRSLSGLSIELLYILACMGFVNYVFDNALNSFNIVLNLVLIRTFTHPLTVGHLLWIVAVSDFVLKLITITVKILLTMLPDRIIPFQKRGKVYLFIEATSQMYRSLATVQPWLYYLLESYQGSEKIIAVFLSAFYMISKGSDVVSRLTLLKGAFFKLLQNVAVGSSPSKEQIQTAGEHCPICHDEYESPVLLQCRHIFCESCVTTWFDREQTCPLCRAKIVDDPSWRDGSTSYFIQLY